MGNLTDVMVCDISIAFNATLTAADKFEKPEPTVVNITERVPVAVQQAMAAGDYVNTRSAPVSLTTQRTVRSCYLYLWHKQKYGRGQAPITDLEKHVRWENETLFAVVADHVVTDSVETNFPEIGLPGTVPVLSQPYLAQKNKNQTDFEGTSTAVISGSPLLTKVPC